MSQSATATHVIPAAVITHTIATIRGQQMADLSVYHARTPDVRIALTWGGVLMHIWSCQAAQGLLEAFSAARAAMTQVPREIPAPANALDEPFARTTLAVDWTRRPTYAVVPQSGPSKAGGNVNALKKGLNEAIERFPKVEGEPGEVHLSRDLGNLPGLRHVHATVPHESSSVSRP